MNPNFVPSADELLTYNVAQAADFADVDLEVAPTRQLAIVACMDSRIDTFKVLGLANGEAHIIRNAGGVITDDVIRSLCLSQRLLGTCEIILVHHTDCGLQKVNEHDFRTQLEDELGVKPWWSLEAFSDPYRDIAQSIQRLYMTPFLPHKENIRGFVYDVTDGLLHEVDLASYPNGVGAQRAKPIQSLAADAAVYGGGRWRGNAEHECTRRDVRAALVGE